MNQLRVLVIERNADRLHRMNIVLKSAQYEVLGAESFDEAMDALRVQRFDAILIGSPGNSPQQAEFTAGLRGLERSLGLAQKTPILLCSNHVPSELWRATHQDGIDAYLPEEFMAATFTDAVLRLAKAVAPNPQHAGHTASDDYPVFEPDKFQAQVAFDKDLMVEIIDLFLTERRTQVAEMNACLAASDFVRLSRVAHTIKGSLGSLHAPQARVHAQELESAAKAADAQVCRFHLAVLEQDLEALEPLLITLRNSVVQP
jgi:two-component system, sensor histidine kinase and response regulator